MIFRSISRLLIAATFLAGTAEVRAQADVYFLTLAEGVTLFDQTQQSCVYEPSVAQLMAQIDTTMSDQLGYDWDTLKQYASGPAGSVLFLLGGSAGRDECQSAGTMIGRAIEAFLGTHPNLAPGPNLAEETQKLMQGGGTYKPGASPKLSEKPLTNEEQKSLASQGDGLHTPMSFLRVYEPDNKLFELKGIWIGLGSGYSDLFRVEADGAVGTWTFSLDCKYGTNLRDEYEVSTSPGSDPRVDLYLPAAARAVRALLCRAAQSGEQPVSQPEDQIDDQLEGD